MIDRILEQFGLLPEKFTTTRITTGHINYTYKVTGDASFILQRVNKEVFKEPTTISSNLSQASKYLKTHYPDYFFLSCCPATDGADLVFDHEGFPWRLFAFIDNTITVDKVDTPDQAYRAAQGFGTLSAKLWNADINNFRETIPRFHDLSLRFGQFQAALKNSNIERRENAARAINLAHSNETLVHQYLRLIESHQLTPRVMHNDTKINNILFDKNTMEVVGVIDLDTLMPGYFIYDLGDMIRTFVSPVSEEEKDTSKIIFRREIYDALISGYFTAMEGCLTAEQKKLAPFAGCMMTYIMALRFLADYLNGDVYYQTHYEGQNLVRAENQLRLLGILQENLI